MTSEPAERRLSAILSADVAGYSRLMAADEDATVRRLAAYREEVALLVRQHRGRLVDFTGDNFQANPSGIRTPISSKFRSRSQLSTRPWAATKRRGLSWPRCGR